MSNVYILRHANLPRFKIGKANNIINRARNFQWDSIDFSNSLGLAVKSEADAFILEKILQRTFRSFGLKANEVISTGGVIDGASEWFDICCWPRLLRYLEENEDLHLHTVISGDILVQLIKSSLKPTEAALLRAQKKEEKETRRLQRLEIERLSRLEQIEHLEKALQAARKILNKELNQHRIYKKIAGISHDHYESRLILIDIDCLHPKESIWRLDLRDTQYNWRYGGGSIISAVSQISLSNASIAAISVSRLFKSEEKPQSSADCIIQRVFEKEFSWLKELPKISNDIIDTIFPLGFLSRNDHNQHQEELVALELIESHKKSPPNIPLLSY